MVQRSSWLWGDSSVVRALVRITRDPVFDPQLHCLNFSSLRPSVSAFFLLTGVLVWFNGFIYPVRISPFFVFNFVSPYTA